jgi:hypothetical protein
VTAALRVAQEKAAQELEPLIGRRGACAATGISQASWYRKHRRSPAPARPARTPKPHPRALSAAERQAVLEVLHSDRFVDMAPAEVYATMLDEGLYLCSEATMYRLLREQGEVRERRRQATHPPRLRSLRPAAVSLLLGLCGGLVGGVLDTAVPPRLVGIGAPATLAGLLFTGYSVTSVLTGLAYGARRWPGSPHSQAELLLFGEVLILLPAALVPSLPAVALAVIGAGGCAAPLLTARSSAIRTELPDEALASGFSSLYAVNGLGYGIAGLVVGSLLPASTALAFTLPLLVILAAVLTLATISRRRSR